MSDRDKYPCIICGKKSSEENPIVTTGDISLCKECIVLCNAIVNADDNKVIHEITMTDFMNGEPSTKL